jgi:hypothetical protein
MMLMRLMKKRLFLQEERKETEVDWGGHGVFTMPGGFHVPSPGGRMDGGSVLGQ